MNTETRNLKDTVNALEALVIHLLSRMHTPAQAEVLIRNAKIENTEEALEAKRKQAEAKKNNEAMRNAVTDFKEQMSSSYWDIAMMTEDERKSFACSMWEELKQAYSLRKNAQQPDYTHTPPSVDELIERRVTLKSARDHINLSHEKSSLEHYTKSLSDLEAAELPEDEKRTRRAGFNRRLDSARGAIKRCESITKELERINALLVKALS